MSELPSYHHFSPTQISQLGFNVKIRCIRNGDGHPDALDDACNIDDSKSDSSNIECGSLITRQVQWQEKIACPSTNDFRGTTDTVAIFTYTNADVTSRKQVQMQFKEPSTAPMRTQQKTFLRKMVNDILSFTRFNSRCPCRDEAKERLLREDSCETMVVMAAVLNSSSIQEIAVCTIRVYRSGLVVATPALSKREAEDFDVGNVFVSNRGFDEVVKNGERVTTYYFHTREGSMYEYSIESNAESGNGCDTDEVIEEHNYLRRENLDHRRELLRKQFEDSGRLYDECCNWTSQATVEIVSASGFYVPNMFLCVPFGSNLMIRYQVKATERCKSVSVLKGCTDYTQSFSTFSSNLEFIVHFLMALIVVFLISMLAFGGSQSDFSQTIFLSIVPLILMPKQLNYNEHHNFNHQFSTMFNSENIRKQGRIVLEVSVIQLHNFGVTSLAGCGSVDLPTDAGVYDLEIMTWKPIACSGVGETRSQMHEYYLGCCLDEIGPSDSAPDEHSWLKEAKTELFSKHDLHTNSSGTIKLRVVITENHFRQSVVANSNPDESESELQRGLIRETVDELLNRIRRNKRGRMAGARMWEVAEEDSKKLSARMEEDAAVQGSVSSRAAEVLERVRRRQLKLPNETPSRH